MSRIACFFLQETNDVSVYLRRYTTTFKEGTCPLHNGYHNASIHIENEPVERSTRGYINNSGKPGPAHNDPRWPMSCACGYVFSEEDEWQRDTHLLYKRLDTGEEIILRNAPSGAMWYAWWFDDMYKPQLEHCLVVKTPGNRDWIIDGQASNCTIPDDKMQEKHHCWVLHGEPPNVTIDKQGTTCSAGAGSVQSGNWHGFLRNGFLEQ